MNYFFENIAYISKTTGYSMKLILWEMGISLNQFEAARRLKIDYSYRYKVSRNLELEKDIFKEDLNGKKVRMYFTLNTYFKLLSACNFEEISPRQAMKEVQNLFIRLRDEEKVKFFINKDHLIDFEYLEVEPYLKGGIAKIPEGSNKASIEGKILNAIEEERALRFIVDIINNSFWSSKHRLIFYYYYLFGEPITKMRPVHKTQRERNAYRQKYFDLITFRLKFMPGYEWDEYFDRIDKYLNKWHK